MLYGPLEAGIGRNVSGWNYRRSSTLNKMGFARTRTHVFQVGKSVICGVRLWGVFRVEE